MGLWDIDKIPYVGREKGPQEGLAFHYYDADKVVAGKKMKDWLRFGVAWWHTFDQQLVDPFGTGTADATASASTTLKQVVIDGKTLCEDTRFDSNQDDWNGYRAKPLASTGAAVTVAALIGLGLLMTGATPAYTSRRRHNA